MRILNPFARTASDRESQLRGRALVAGWMEARNSWLTFSINRKLRLYLIRVEGNRASQARAIPALCQIGEVMAEEIVTKLRQVEVTRSLMFASDQKQMRSIRGLM